MVGEDPIECDQERDAELTPQGDKIATRTPDTQGFQNSFSFQEHAIICTR